MRRFILPSVALVAALALSACGGKAGEASLEKGQVVATVNGTDITVNELNAELLGVSLPPAGEKRKAIEQQALQGLVNRTILGELARESGVDKSPAYILQKRRAEETLLVQMFQRDIASKIPTPTADEGKSFMASNPGMFAERKIFALDQIQFQAPDDINKLKAYEPLKTMEQVAAQLTTDGLQFRRAAGQLDTATANPELVRQIVSLPAGEIFIIPGNGAFIASRVTGVKTEPLSGEKAVQYAVGLVQQKKIADETERQLAEKIKKAREAVKYQDGYAPPKAPAASPKPATTAG
jgi:peptidyl-prolyl cis-trans isomerase C